MSVNISLVSVLSQLQKANQDVTSPQLLISSFSHFSLDKAFFPLQIFFYSFLNVTALVVSVVRVMI